MGPHLCRSTRGVHQGDRLGPLLVALAIHCFLLSLRMGVSGCLTKVGLDDGTLVGDTGEVRDTLLAKVREGPDPCGGYI